MPTDYKFKYSPSHYTVQGAETLMRKDPKGMREEYTKMRDIAQKRIQRLGKEFDWTKTFSGNQGGIPKLRNIDPRDLPKAFKELASFVKWSGSTVKGQRQMQEKTSATLSQAVGGKKAMELPPELRPVNAGNYKRVIKILDEARKQKITYDSNKMVELANATLDLTQKQFDSILDNLSVFLQHSDEVEEAMIDYENEHDAPVPVDMGKFIKELGW